MGDIFGGYSQNLLLYIKGKCYWRVGFPHRSDCRSFVHYNIWLFCRQATWWRERWWRSWYSRGLTSSRWVSAQGRCAQRAWRLGSATRNWALCWSVPTQLTAFKGTSSPWVHTPCIVLVKASSKALKFVRLEHELKTCWLHLLHKMTIIKKTKNHTH